MDKVVQKMNGCLNLENIKELKVITILYNYYMSLD